MSLRVILLVFVTTPLLAYDGNHRIVAEVSPGVGIGWWVYNKGVTKEGQKLGWDHTHSSAMFTVTGALLYQHKQWKVGFGGGYAMLLDDAMLTTGEYQYSIADQWVQFTLYYGQVEYALFKNRRFSFSAMLKFGSFRIYTTHPEAGNFGRRFFWEAGFSNQIEIAKGFSCIIQPKYLNMTIFPEQKKADKERHGIYSLGLNVGIRYVVK